MLNGHRVLVLGGDGFCGWPVALRASEGGAEVHVVDNFSRRRIDEELGTVPFVPLQSMAVRLDLWEKLSGRRIGFHALDLAQDYDALCDLLRELAPDTIIHLGEQRSAPYSMLTAAGARYTIANNIPGTHNLLEAMVRSGSDAHLIHIGTIGIYGYGSAGIRLPEGYLPVVAKGSDGREVTREILYPGEPDSLYHLSKALDQQLFAFFVRREGLRVTDLHQGVVWGSQTKETRRDPGLANRFDHDPVYGTVVNRFITQACRGEALTVYGSGTQTRAFIHIEDVLRCIFLALANPPQDRTRTRIINQIAETSSILALAERVSELTGAEIRRIPNPRTEPEHNEFDVDRDILRRLGFEPRTFASDLGREISDVRALRRE